MESFLSFLLLLLLLLAADYTRARSLQKVMTKPEKRLHIGAKKIHFPLSCLYFLFTSLEEKLFEISKQLLQDDGVRKPHYISDWLGIKNKQRGQFDTNHP